MSDNKNNNRYSGWKKRYAYLDDYKKGMDGKYVYYGRHYIFKGDAAGLKKYKCMLALIDVVLTALFIIGGCVDAGAVWNKWYIVIPFALELVGIFLIIWKTVSLITEKVPVKAYILKKTASWFGPLAVITTVFCAISAAATAICLIADSLGVKTAGAVIYLVIKLVMGAVCVFMYDQQKKNEWELDPSEEPEQI